MFDHCLDRREGNMSSTPTFQDMATLMMALTPVIGKWAANAEPEAVDHEQIEKQRKVLRTYCALKRRGLLRGLGYCANTLY